MPCPFFDPNQPVDRLNGVEPGRAPLHRLYGGTCTAGGQESQPSEAMLEQFCNFGYGRNRCEWFPEGATAVDAIRFHRQGDVILYIHEQAWNPVAHGIVPQDSELLSRQARAFLDSFPTTLKSE